MKSKKRLIYFISAISGVLVLCYLIMVLLFPLFINKEALKEKISAVLSQKISGQVDFRNIDISFFPIPHARIDRLKIHFFNGNKVSLASLEVFPSIMRLFSGDLRISKIHAHSPELYVAYSRKQESSSQEKPESKVINVLDELSSFSPDFTVSIRNGILNLMKGEESIFTLRNFDSDISLDKNGLALNVNASTTFSKNISGKGFLPKPNASVKNFILNLEAEDIDLFLARQTAISLIGENPLIDKIFSYIKMADIPAISFNSQGSSFEDLWKLDNIFIKAHLKNTTIFIPILQFEFIEAAGNCTLSRGILKADKLEGKLETAHLQNGNLEIGLTGENAPFHLAIHTKTDSDMVSRLLKRFLKEPSFPLNSLQILKSPVEGTLVLGESTAIFKEWKNKGIFAFNGAINVNNGPVINLDIAVNPKGIIIKELDLHDNSSDAELKLNLQQKVASLQFKGTLTSETIRKLFKNSSFQKGSLRGKFDATIDIENTTQSMASGYLSAQNISFLKDNLPINVKQIYLNAIRNRINVESGTLTISDTTLTTKGTVDLISKGMKADMEISSEAFHWKTIQELISPAQKASMDKKKESSQKPIITGTLRVQAKNFLFDSTNIRQVKANISLLSDSIHVSVTEASLCGLSLPGTVDIKRDSILMNFSLDAQQKELKPVISCLTDKRSVLSGTFNIESTVSAESKAETLIKAATGNIHIIAKNGRIYKGTMFPKIFSILNVTGIFEGGIADMTKGGFGYNSILIDADIKNGNIVLRKAVMDAPSMKMVGTGNIDITKKRYNLKILASPLKTVDSLVGKIPLIRDITGGSLISVPIAVTGDLKNPTVNYLPVSSVGSGLLGIMENTIKLPVKIFQPSSQE